MILLDLPIDVAGVENCTVDTSDLRVCSSVFDVDRCPPLVRSHCVVSQHGCPVDCGSNIVENPVLLGLHVPGDDAPKSDNTHYTHDGVVKVRPVVGDGDVCGLAILCRVEFHGVVPLEERVQIFRGHFARGESGIPLVRVLVVLVSRSRMGGKARSSPVVSVTI